MRRSSTRRGSGSRTTWLTALYAVRISSYSFRDSVVDQGGMSVTVQTGLLTSIAATFDLVLFLAYVSPRLSTPFALPKTRKTHLALPLSPTECTSPVFHLLRHVDLPHKPTPSSSQASHFQFSPMQVVHQLPHEQPEHARWVAVRLDQDHIPQRRRWGDRGAVARAEPEPPRAGEGGPCGWVVRRDAVGDAAKHVGARGDASPVLGTRG